MCALAKRTGLVMMTATALRKHQEGMSARVSIAFLFTPFPASPNNLLVFFCGHAKSFEHPRPYEEEDLPPLEIDVPLSSCSADSSFHDLAHTAFQVALPTLLQEGMRLATLTDASCIVCVDSRVQQSLALDLAARSGYSAQAAPENDARPTASLVLLVARANRGRNFGRFCNSLIHLPLPLGLPGRQQLYGRVHRGPRRRLLYQLLIPRGTVLECLAQAQKLDASAHVNIKRLVEQAMLLNKR
jgi:hypothetical protein